MNFREEFRGPDFDPELKWYNRPPEYSLAGGLSSDVLAEGLSIRPAKNTDFWQKTYYGFTPDNGHFLGLELCGNFVLETHVHFRFASQFDQAGLMVRTGPEHWLKTGVEHQLQGPSSLGVVMTHVSSDWSIADFEGSEVYLRVKRIGDAFGVYHAADGQNWRLMRLGELRLGDPVQAGLYACCPIDAGSEVRFDYLDVSPIIDEKFHD